MSPPVWVACAASARAFRAATAGSSTRSTARCRVRCADRVARGVDAQLRRPAPRGAAAIVACSSRAPGRGRGERGAGPRRDRLVVGMPGEAVRAEGQHGVRPDPRDQLGEPPTAVDASAAGAPAVAVAQPVVLVHAEDGQALGELAGAFGGEPLRRPGHRVGGAELAAGGGHAHHALAVGAGERHQAAGQVRLVVGVRPDPHDGAEGADVGLHGSEGAARRPTPRCRALSGR